MKIDMSKVKRVVVKVGTSTITHSTGLINIRKVDALARCICDLQNSGKQMMLVSSGAVGCGMAKIGFKAPLTIEQKQASAAVGQCELIDMYNRIFTSSGHIIAQVLITKDVLEDEERCKNARNTLKALLCMGCIPIFNENDVVSSEQLSIGSNDTLSAAVALLTDSDLLINMSDTDGLYTKNPRDHKDAQQIPFVEKIDDKIKSYAGGAGTSRGTGGMIAKLEAAEMVVKKGIPMIIVNGDKPDILYDIFDGDFRGTYFKGEE